MAHLNWTVAANGLQQKMKIETKNIPRCRCEREDGKKANPREEKGN